MIDSFRNGWKKIMGAQPEAATGKTILVVDDERAMRDSLRRALEKHGFFVATADSYEAAMKCLNETTVDLCVFDIAMEEKSGLDLLKTIRSDDRYRDLPVIVQSGFGEKFQREAIALTPVAVFQKPVQLDQLLWTIRDALRLPET